MLHAVEKILEAAPHKTAAVRPPVSYLTKYTSKAKIGMRGTTGEAGMN